MLIPQRQNLEYVQGQIRKSKKKGAEHHRLSRSIFAHCWADEPPVDFAVFLSSIDRGSFDDFAPYALG